MDIRCPIPRGPYHSLTPLQPSERNPFPWEEAPESLNELLKRLAS
jgi:hypothetical protein